MNNNGGDDMMDSDLDAILEAIADGDAGDACDLIIELSDFLDDDAVTDIMAAVRVVDPTFSGLGAEVRDTLRDNTEFEVA